MTVSHASADQRALGPSGCARGRRGPPPPVGLGAGCSWARVRGLPTDRHRRDAAGTEARGRRTVRVGVARPGRAPRPSPAGLLDPRPSSRARVSRPWRAAQSAGAVGAGHAGSPRGSRRRRHHHRYRHRVCRRCAPLTRGDEIPGLGAGVRVPVRGRDDGGAVPEQHLPLGRGRHVAGADAALLTAALRPCAAHAPLRAPRLQPRPAARAAAAPATARATLQVRAGPPAAGSGLPGEGTGGRSRGPGPGRPARLLSSTVAVTGMRQEPGRVGIEPGRTAFLLGASVGNC